MIKFAPTIFALLGLGGALVAADQTAPSEGQITELTIKRALPILLKKGEVATTKDTFRSPVEIEIIAKTDGPSLLIGYAANKVIFNSKVNPSNLIIRGGPADKKDRPGTGQLPLNKYVSIRWLVTLKKQSIFVDNDLRFEHEGDYSTINNPVSVWSEHDAKVTVKSIKVKQLPQESK